MVLAGAGVLGLLHDDGGVARQVAGEAHGGGHGRVAGRAALEALELGHRLGDVEHLALRHREVAVDVAQRPGRVARHVGAVRPGGERHAEAGVAGGEALAVEVVVAGHVQAAEVDRGADDLGVGRAGTLQAAGRAGGVAAAGVGDHDVRRVRAGEALHLAGDLEAQGLDAAHAEAAVERGGEVAGHVEQFDHVEEELGTDGELHDLGAVGLADAALLDDLRLADVAAVERLLDDDALEAVARRLAGDGGAVVARRRGDDALVALLLGHVDADAGAPVLEGAGEVGGLVLDEDARALAGLAHAAHEVGEVPELEQRRAAHAGARLDGDDLVQASSRARPSCARSRRRWGSARTRCSPCRAPCA